MVRNVVSAFAGTSDCACSATQSANQPAASGGARRKRDLRRGGARLFGGDRAGVRHRRQHLARAGRGGGRIGARIEPRRRARQPRQHRRLPQRHASRRDAEIHPRRGVHAPGAGAEIDAVQPDLEDLALAEAVLQPQRQQQFLHLAAERARVGQEQVLGDLLGDGRAALHQPPAGEVDPDGARQADRIDAGMVPEPAILDRDRGGRQIGRHVGQPQRIADDVAEGGEHVAGAVLQREARPARRVQRGFGPRQVAREPQQHDARAPARPRPRR